MYKSYFHEDAGLALEGVPRHLLQDGRVLLTGASGVVGIHMAAAFRRLIDEGSKLRLRVTFQSPVDGVVAEMLNHPQIQVIRGDLTYPGFRSRLDQAELILHAAGYGQPGRFLENPSKTIRLVFDKVTPSLAPMSNAVKNLGFSPKKYSCNLSSKFQSAYIIRIYSYIIV